MRGLWGVRFFNGLRVGKLKREWGFVGVGLCGACEECVFFNGLRVGKLKKGVGFVGVGL